MHPARNVACKYTWRVISALGAFSCARAAETDSDLFRERIEPILRDNCFKCHSHSAEKIKGGLVLDSRSAALTGGDSGPALVPGLPGKSLLIEAIGYTNEDLQMPPKGKKLSAEQIALLTDWVKQGATWPEHSGERMKTRPKGGITAADRQWWAFQPIAKVVPPPADSWGVNDIDRFIGARLKAAGLKPAPRAPKAALIRRVYFDVTGLPPPPEEVEQFVADSAPDAYAKLVDRLLASPRYGERWATHWLDLVRYAETDGYKSDEYRPNAWRYRDYVIAAFNSDLPYDRFVQEQLAGDELWPDNPTARIATGYLAHWIYEYNQRDAVGQRETILNDITDTTADVFLGIGLQCARCHDHKFDPLLQKDYFRLQAFFAPLDYKTKHPVATPAEGEAYERKRAAWEAKTSDLRRQLAELDAPYRAQAERDARKKFPTETRAILDRPAAERTPFEQQIVTLLWRQVEDAWDEKRFAGIVKEPARSKRGALLKELKKFETEKPDPLPHCRAITDIGRVAPPVVIPRKSALGEIAPGFLTLLDPGPAQIEAVATPTTGRRAALARWITRPENPLTSRVIVNRIWQHHFGRGLALNASDFGRLGEAPSHPELLDWLARTFVEGGWSLKKLHRLILTSATYTQSSTSPFAAMGTLKDPENRLLWRGSIRRLDAEEIRDALLSATSELTVSAGGPSADPDVPVRTIYNTVRRNRRDSLIEAFDQPERFTSNAERHVTTTATQALLLINSAWAQERASAFAARLTQRNTGAESAIVDDAFRQAFQRNPTVEERSDAQRFLDRQAARNATEEPDEEIVPFMAEKMRFRDGSAAVIAEGSLQERLVVPNTPMPAKGEFTIEAYINLKSAYESDAVRTIVSQGGTRPGEPGWALGVTGMRSHMPQNLVLKLFGNVVSGQETSGSEVLYSGLHIPQDTPYYVGVAVRLNDASEHGITFFAKDLTDSDDPLRKVQVVHAFTGRLGPKAPLVIGGQLQGKESLFDGLIDDVRLSEVPLGPEELLLSNASVRVHTMGYWKFESKEDPFSDSSNRGHVVSAAKIRRARPDPRAVALVDFCHVLLNSNEFLHVE